MNIRYLMTGLLLAMLVATAPAASADERWAAIAPNNDNISKVAWAASRDEAMASALAACRQVSQSCAESPAVTDDMQDIFVTMCCLNPRFGCVTYPGPSIADGREGAMKTLQENNFSECSLRAAIMARDGTDAR